VFAGLEPLHRYKRCKHWCLLRFDPLQSRYSGVTGRYNPTTAGRRASLRAMEGNERAGQVGTEKAAFWRVDALSQSRLKGTATEGVLEESGR